LVSSHPQIMGQYHKTEKDDFLFHSHRPIRWCRTHVAEITSINNNHNQASNICS
jgi:hypothetical protein